MTHSKTARPATDEDEALGPVRDQDIADFFKVLTQQMLRGRLDDPDAHLSYIRSRLAKVA